MEQKLKRLQHYLLVLVRFVVEYYSHYFAFYLDNPGPDGLFVDTHNSFLQRADLNHYLNYSFFDYSIVDCCCDFGYCFCYFTFGYYLSCSIVEYYSDCSILNYCLEMMIFVYTVGSKEVFFVSLVRPFILEVLPFVQLG